VEGGVFGLKEVAGKIRKEVYVGSCVTCYTLTVFNKVFGRNQGLQRGRKGEKQYPGKRVGRGIFWEGFWLIRPARQKCVTWERMSLCKVAFLQKESRGGPGANRRRKRGGGFTFR